MRVIICLAAAVTLTVLTACGRHKVADIRAHIIERRMSNDGRLLIRYLFKKQGTLVVDSAEFEHETVVPHDSVKVIFTPGDSSEHKLVLP
ncbi:hypothetical protein [Deminuibacter soli]|uniref:hypothetical protein n=1 Tax=Deminuibacter soli TaxID=2291815 RepID=UPI0011C0D968|nr:hypothetical protein [Deminuibacter soli]